MPLPKARRPIRAGLDRPDCPTGAKSLSNLRHDHQCASVFGRTGLEARWPPSDLRAFLLARIR